MYAFIYIFIYVCCLYLRGVGDSERDDVFAGVFNEEVMLVQQLHLPHPQPPQLIKKLEEPDNETESERADLTSLTD